MKRYNTNATDTLRQKDGDFSCPTDIGNLSDTSEVMKRYCEVQLLLKISIMSDPISALYCTMRGRTDTWMLPR